MKMQRLLVASVVFITAISQVGCGQKKETKKSKAKAPAEVSRSIKSYEKPVNPSEPVGQNTAPSSVPNATPRTTVAQEPEGLSYIPPIEETATSTTTIAPSATAPANSSAQPGAPSSVNGVPVNNAQASVSSSTSNASLNTSAPLSVSTSVKNAPINSTAQSGVSSAAKNAPVNSSGQPSGLATANNALQNPSAQPNVSASVKNAPLNSNVQPSASGSVKNASISSNVQPSVSASGNVTPAVVELHQGPASGASAVSQSSPVVTGAASTSSASIPLKSAQ